MLKLLADLPDDPPTRDAWRAIKERLEVSAGDVVKLTAVNQDLRRQSRTSVVTKPGAAAALGGGKGKSGRRSFAASKRGASRGRGAAKLKPVSSAAASAAEPEVALDAGPDA